MHKIFSCIVMGTWLFTCQAALAGDFPTVNFPADNQGNINFSMPSRNVECLFIAKSEVTGAGIGQPEIDCDRAQPAYWHFYLGAKGLAEVDKHPGEQPCCGNELPILPYGSSFRAGPFECDSMAMGLRCEREDGHGFFISKANAKAY